MLRQAAGLGLDQLEELLALVRTQRHAIEPHPKLMKRVDLGHGAAVGGEDNRDLGQEVVLCERLCRGLFLGLLDGGGIEGLQVAHLAGDPAPVLRCRAGERPLAQSTEDLSGPGWKRNAEGLAALRPGLACKILGREPVTWKGGDDLSGCALGPCRAGMKEVREKSGRGKEEREAGHEQGLRSSLRRGLQKLPWVRGWRSDVADGRAKSGAALTSVAIITGYSQWFHRLLRCCPELMKGRALVAWNLRRIRVARGVSQEKLAADAGVDRAYLGGLERQEENPTVDLLDRVAEALSVMVSELFMEPLPGEAAPQPLRKGRKPAQ